MDTSSDKDSGTDSGTILTLDSDSDTDTSSDTRDRPSLMKNYEPCGINYDGKSKK